MNYSLKNIPIVETLLTYKKVNIRFDFMAALTVAVVALPQSMAYAIIAGVDPVYGLYSAIVLSILGSAFGSSNHLATGPTNAISLLIASFMSSYLGKENFYETLFLLTFLVGAIQFSMGAMKLGKLVNYVSHSVIVGFTAGAGVIIALGQFSQLLGVTLPKGNQSTLEKVMLTLQNIDHTNYYALGLGMLTLAIIIVAKKINKNLPGALIGIVVSVILVMTMGLSKYGVKLTGEIPSAIPPFTMVDFNLSSIHALFSGALVIALIGLVEAAAISKAISSKTLQKVDSNQEFIGQGIANMGGAFFRCIAGSGSFTRSAITHHSGGRTRLTGVLSGIIVLVVLILFAPFAKYIPNASLAGVIMMVAYSLVDKKALVKVYKSNKNDAMVLVVTALTTILAPDLEDAIYAGMALSVILFLRESGTASVRVLVPGEDGLGRFVEYNKDDQRKPKESPVSIIQLEGNLYFGSAADLEQKLDEAYSDAKAFILRFDNVSAADISSIEVIENFVNRAASDGKKVMLSGVSQEIKKIMVKCHLVDHIGLENIFMSEKVAFAPTTRSLEAAYHFIETGKMPEGSGISPEEVLESVAYQKWSFEQGKVKLLGAAKGFGVFVDNYGVAVVEREIDTMKSE